MMARKNNPPSGHGSTATGIRILTAHVQGVEKRKKPNKHYAYVIDMAWSDGTVNIIYRRYSDFYDLQCLLLKQFKKEAGTKKPCDRILPFLPGRSLFGRKEKVAMSRIQALDDYCKTLVTLPDNISNSQGVIRFFRPTEEDIELSRKGTIRKHSGGAEEISGPITLEMYVAIADYTRDSKDQINLKEGMEVEVIEKHVTGWWMVTAEDKQGWVPSTYIENTSKNPDDEPEGVKCAPGAEERYIVTASHKADLADELELQSGTLVEVIEKTLDGWWLIRSGGRTGRAPGTKMARADTTKARAALHRGAAHGRQHSAPEETGPPSASGQDDSEDFSPSSQPPPRRETIKVRPRHLRKTRKTLRGQRYQVREHFRPSGQGMAVSRGQTLVLMEKSPGWWLMRHGENQGWVPSNVLQKEGSALSIITAATFTEEEAGASQENQETTNETPPRKSSVSEMTYENVPSEYPKTNQETSAIYANTATRMESFDNNEVCVSIPTEDPMYVVQEHEASKEPQETTLVSSGTSTGQEEVGLDSSSASSIPSKANMTSRSTSFDHGMVDPAFDKPSATPIMTSRSTSFDHELVEDTPLPPIKDKEAFGTVTIRRGLVAQRSRSFNKGSSGKVRKNSDEICFASPGILQKQLSNESQDENDGIDPSRDSSEPSSPVNVKPSSIREEQESTKQELGQTKSWHFRKQGEDTAQDTPTRPQPQKRPVTSQKDTPSSSASETSINPASHRGAMPLDVTIGENPSPQQGATYNMNSRVAFLPQAELEGKPVYMARTNFTGGEDNEADLEFGELVVVLEKAGRGWWKVQSKSGIGWVPSHFLRNTAEVFNSNKEAQEQSEEPSNTAITEKQKLMSVPRELPDYSTAKPRPRERVSAPVARKVNQQLSRGKENKKNLMSLRIVEDKHKPVDELLKMFSENGAGD